MAKFRPISEAALKKAQARAAENPTPRAISVSFNRTVDMINIELNTGATVSFPPELIEGVKDTKTMKGGKGEELKKGHRQEYSSGPAKKSCHSADRAMGREARFI